MTRKQLLNFICPTVRKNNCEEYQCSDCTILLNKWLNEYDKNIIEQYNIDTNLKEHDKQIRVKVIDEYKNVLLKTNKIQDTATLT